MAFSLQNVVPWGRLFDEYVAMFALNESDLKKQILGCSDGPASFNATLTKQNGRITSIDPIYQFTAEQIQQRFNEAYDQVISQLESNKDEFVWTHFDSVADLAATRTQAMSLFIADYEQGKQDGRYQFAELPKLPFEDGVFDLVLCSHFLFLYSQHFTADFHITSIKELCRVASELRIFPLLELGSKPSRHLETVIKQLEQDGYQTDIVTVDYEFQRGGSQMLKVSKN